MPTLKNLTHERFARLVAQGMTQTAAFESINPAVRYPQKQASELMLKFGVKERVAEIKEMIDAQFAMQVGEKRDLLRRMALGEVPTKVIKKANGKIEAIFDRHAALVTDAKLAGEFAAEKVTMDIGPSIKLDFQPAYRNTQITPALEAEYKMIENTPAAELPEPEPVVLDETPAEIDLESLEEYANVDVSKRPSIELADIAANNVFVDPSDDKPLKLRGLPKSAN